MSDPLRSAENQAGAIELEAFEAVANAMESAEHAIDTQFGAGYAEKHPVMIAGYLQAVAVTYLADIISGHLRELVCELEGVKLTVEEVRRG